MLFHYSTILVIQILLKKKLEIVFNIHQKKLNNNINFFINEILSNPFTSISLTKVFKNPKIQMEHSHLIVEPNVIHTHTHTHTYLFIYLFSDWELYDNNIFELLEVCPNLTYYTKTSKFINMFPNIKKTKSQIMNDKKYMYIKKSQESFINDKVQSSYVQCTLEEIKQPIPNNIFLWNMMFNQIK